MLSVSEFFDMYLGMSQKGEEAWVKYTRLLGRFRFEQELVKPDVGEVAKKRLLFLALLPDLGESPIYWDDVPHDGYLSLQKYYLLVEGSLRFKEFVLTLLEHALFWAEPYLDDDDLKKKYFWFACEVLSHEDWFSETERNRVFDLIESYKLLLLRDGFRDQYGRFETFFGLIARSGVDLFYKQKAFQQVYKIQDRNLVAQLLSKTAEFIDRHRNRRGWQQANPEKILVGKLLEHCLELILANYASDPVSCNQFVYPLTMRICLCYDKDEDKSLRKAIALFYLVTHSFVGASDWRRGLESFLSDLQHEFPELEMSAHLRAVKQRREEFQAEAEAKRKNTQSIRSQLE